MLTGLQLCQQALVLLDAWHEEKKKGGKQQAPEAVEVDDIVVDDEEDETTKKAPADEVELSGVPVLRAAVVKAWKDYAPLRAKLLTQRRAAGRRPAFLDEVRWWFGLCVVGVGWGW